MPSRWTENAPSLKAELRVLLRGRRLGIAADEQLAAGERTAAGIAAWLGQRSNSTAMLYAPIRGEVSTVPLDALLRAAGWHVAYPRVESVDPPVMEARATLSLADLTPGSFDIPEPQKERCEIVPAEGIRLVIVPGLAFDPAGGRLGFGVGYYDRFLDRCLGATLIGLCYAWQVVGAVPREPHDVPMDGLLSPDGLIWANAG